MRRPVDRYVDRLLRRRRPKPFAPTEDEIALLRTAIDLMAAVPGAEDPRPGFVEELRGRLADQGPDRDREQQSAELPRPARRAPARRRFVAAGALTATAAAAGVGADRLLTRGTSGDEPAPLAEISPTHGTWQTAAGSAELSEGAVLPFDLGAVNGFLRRVSGRVQAVSGTCTHQGCRLDLSAARDRLACPCHGATFSLAGANLTRPLESNHPLPALPRLPVREQGGLIQIYAPAPASPVSTTPA